MSGTPTLLAGIGLATTGSPEREPQRRLDEAVLVRFTGFG
jgi:hypothetical protein